MLDLGTGTGAVAEKAALAVGPGGHVLAIDISPEMLAVKFQQTAGQFAPSPPVPGVGPGALADPQPFLEQLGRAGIDAHVETEVLGFDFDDFASAWNALAGVTTAMLPPRRQREAQAAVRAAMWPNPSEPRHFNNTTQFIIGLRR